MKIGYLRLDHGEWSNGTYNSQEIGLAKAYEKLGHEVTIFYCVFRKDPKCFTVIKLTEHIRKAYLPANSLGHHAKLNMDELDSYELDLLHIQGDNLLRVPEAVKYCQRRRIQYYCYVGRIDSEKQGKLHRIMTSILSYRNCKVYINNPTFVKTPAMKKQLEQCGAKNIAIAPVGLDLSIIPLIVKTKEQLRDELELPQKTKIILCVSRLVEGKQPYDIFELAKKLEDTTHYVFIGGWDEAAADKFRNRIQGEGLSNRFTFLPRVPNIQIHKYYRAVDFVVNFNQHEIFGMAILEAMYQGATVVARRAPGPEFIIEDKKSGYLAASLDEMAQLVCGSKIDAGSPHNRVIDNFSWDSTASIILNQLKLINGAGSEQGGLGNSINN